MNGQDSPPLPSDSASTKIAVLFTDLSNTALLYKTLGTVAGRAIVEQCNQILMHIIKAYHGRVVKSVGDSILACFESPKEALFAARAMQKKISTTVSKQRSAPEQVQLRIALNYGYGIIEEHDVFGDVVNIAGKLITYCADSEILLTEPLYQEVCPCADIVFEPIPAPEVLHHVGISKVYRVVVDAQQKSESAPVDSESRPLGSVFSHLTPPAAGRRCFYCGTTAHAAATCPSKFLPTPTAAAPKLCRMAPTSIASLIKTHYAMTVRPLQTGGKDERHDMILHGKLEDPGTLIFFSFYEATQPFQLRSLRQVTRGGDDDATAQSLRGALRIAEDCIRVSRHVDAQTWIAKAQKELPDDYRVLVLSGLLEVEQGDLSVAQSLFSTAYQRAPAAHQRRCIASLLARSAELCNEPEHAGEELVRAGCCSDEHPDLLFYEATLLIQTGEVEKALAILRRLGEREPHFFILLTFLMPHLPARDTLEEFLNGAYSRLHERARRCCEAMRTALTNHAALLDPDDAAHRQASVLCSHAACLLSEGSISGLAEVPLLKTELSSLLQQALGTHTRELRQRAASFSRHHKRYQQYLDHFPYPHLVTARYRQLGEDCEKLCSEVQAAAERTSPIPVHIRRHMLQRLSETTLRLTRAHARLERNKKIWFTLLCCVQGIIVGLATGVASALACTGILVLYRVYETETLRLASAVLQSYLRFGLGSGLIAGVMGAGFWFAKNVSSRYKKINQDR